MVWTHNLGVFFLNMFAYCFIFVPNGIVLFYSCAQHRSAITVRIQKYSFITRFAPLRWPSKVKLCLKPLCSQVVALFSLKVQRWTNRAPPDILQSDGSLHVCLHRLQPRRNIRLLQTTLTKKKKEAIWDCASVNTVTSASLHGSSASEQRSTCCCGEIVYWET